MPDFGVTKDTWLANIYLAALTVAGGGGKKGPSIDQQRQRSDLLEDELIGKLGPAISVYNAEGANRITGEWE